MGHSAAGGASSTLRAHWPEYAMEAAGLGTFMLSACSCAALLFHPDSPVSRVMASTTLQAPAMGLAMGLTAIAIIYSPWGRRSGAHINPSVTLTFWRLGKIHGWDALFYASAQFAGALSGVLFARLLLGSRIAHPSVNYVVTVPNAGPTVAFMVEVGMSLGLMTAVLVATNTARLSRWTGLFAGALVALYITFLAPLSGMSINPARSFGSAVPAQVWTSFWLYLFAPPAGMLLAGEVFSRIRGRREVVCAKLVHDHASRCIFRRCAYGAPGAPTTVEPVHQLAGPAGQQMR